MPNTKTNRKTRTRRKAAAPQFPPCGEWVWRQLMPLLRRPPLAGSRPARHVRNASIEMLEAARDFLDATIEWLRHEQRRPPEMHRIRVQG
jgi:hypothetical protein